MSRDRPARSPEGDLGLSVAPLDLAWSRRVKAQQMAVAARNFDEQKWKETWIVPIKR